jgi:putative methionine-R-sulfoxide reductase with GAF domain
VARFQANLPATAALWLKTGHFYSTLQRSGQQYLACQEKRKKGLVGVCSVLCTQNPSNWRGVYTKGRERQATPFFLYSSKGLANCNTSHLGQIHMTQSIALTSFPQLTF